MPFLPPHRESASQTAGPYVHIGCVPTFAGISTVYPDDLGAVMLGEEAKGERIEIVGRVFDGAGAPLKDALLEIWQADAAGLFNSPSETRGVADPAFSGWGRQPTDGATGQYRFQTIKPGPVPWPDGRMQAPHISMWIVARGINLGLNTRLYFSDEEAANAEDPLLSRLEHPTRAKTLIAQREGTSYTFDVNLQGENETVFFDV